MKYLLRILLLVVLIGTVAQIAGAQGLLSRPEIPGHAVPTSTFPEPPAGGWDDLDVAALLLALAAASYMGLVSRWRKGLFGLAIVSLLWFGFWRDGCVCSIGAIQNVALALFDPHYAVSFTVLAFFALPLVFTLFFGRTFCAAVCPLGAVQELVALRPVKVPGWLDQTLGLLAYVYLGLAVVFAATGTAFVICEYDPFVAMFRLSGSLNMLVLGGCFLVVGFFIGRPYCRYLCPYGAILKLLSKLSKWHVRIPPEDCINCRLCEDACPYGAIRPPTVQQAPAVRVAGRRRLVGLLVLVPGLVVLGVGMGGRLAVPLSMLHPKVQLAERVRQEELGLVDDTTDASEAFRNTGRPKQELYAQALALRERFARAGWWLGGWVGLVLGIKLLHTGIRRRRGEYLADRGNCVSCGRCFWYCPAEQVRLGLIENVEMVVQK